jgi:signal transduction histidine kinase
VDLVAGVTAALASVRRPSGGSEAVIDVQIPLGVHVMADPRRLEQVIANLVENGLVHGAPPVVISLGTPQPGLVEISVADQGPGLDADAAEGVWRGLRTRGLTLVKGLVEGMGGTVAYRDKAFRFTLPTPRG